MNKTDKQTKRKPFESIAIDALQTIADCDNGAICCREIARKALAEIAQRKANFRKQMDKALASVS